MGKLTWLLFYVLSCALAAFWLVTGATYWNFEIGAYAGGGGAMFGLLGYLLVRYGPKRPDPTTSWARALENALMELLRVESQRDDARALLHRTLAYLGHKPFDSITVGELYDDIQKHFAKPEEVNRD